MLQPGAAMVVFSMWGRAHTPRAVPRRTVPSRDDGDAAARWTRRVDPGENSGLSRLSPTLSQDSARNLAADSEVMLDL